MSDTANHTHRYYAYRDGRQVLDWADDGTDCTEQVIQMMRDDGLLVIRRRVQKGAIL